MSWTRRSAAGSRRGPLAEVLAAFDEAEAAIGPVYDVSGVMSDPQYAALGTVHTIDDEELGPVKMQNVLFRAVRARPGSIRWAGRPHGADTDEVLAEIGVDARPARRPARQRHRVSACCTDGPIVTGLYVPGRPPGTLRQGGRDAAPNS